MAASASNILLKANLNLTATENAISKKPACANNPTVSHAERLGPKKKELG